MMKLKVTKNQGFTLSLVDTFLVKQQGHRFKFDPSPHPPPPPPSFLKIN